MCLKHNQSKKQGFTIIEVLVVLVIVGLISAVVAPNVFTMLNSAKTQALESELRTSVMQLPLKAKLSQRRFEIASVGELSVVFESELSELSAFTLNFEPALIVNENGFCRGADVRLAEGQITVKRYKIEAPYCNLTSVH